MALRSVNLPGTHLTASALGFGCASLGSRISRRAGLKALNDAYDHGVSWYDVAPPYGADEAEGILGEFLQGKRERVVVCTKAGLSGPPRSALVKLAYTFGRPLANQFKQLRRGFRALPATRYQRKRLDAEMIASSIDRSLQRLRTDHVDVFALHDPAPEDVTKDDVMRALETIVSSGKARYLSVAGSESACLAGFMREAPYTLAQIADDPVKKTLSSLRANAGRQPGCITHSVFGVDGMLGRLTALIAANGNTGRLLHEHGYTGGAPRMAADLLLDRAMASNPDGVVLTSMFGAQHRAANISRAELPLNAGAIDLLSSILAQPEAA